MCRLRLTHTARPPVYSPGMLLVQKKPFLWFVNPKKLHVASIYEINFLKVVIICYFVPLKIITFLVFFFKLMLNRFKFRPTLHHMLCAMSSEGLFIMPIQVLWIELSEHPEDCLHSRLLIGTVIWLEIFVCLDIESKPKPSMWGMKCNLYTDFRKNWIFLSVSSQL